MNLKTRVSIFLASACMASSLAYVLSHHKLSATAAARLRPTPTDSDAVLKPGRSTSPRSVQSSPGALATCPEHRILRANKTKSHKGSTNSTKHRRYLEISGYGKVATPGVAFHFDSNRQLADVLSARLDRMARIALAA